jgi:hypothetical protein
MFAALLHDRLFRAVPFATSSAKFEDDHVLEPGEYYYSQTLTHGSEFRPMVEKVADQIAAGIRASYPNGFQCVQYDRLTLLDRFRDSSISRAETFGLATAAIASKVGEDRMQLTLLTRVIEWPPK